MYSLVETRDEKGDRRWTDRAETGQGRQKLYGLGRDRRGERRQKMYGLGRDKRGERRHKMCG